MKLFKRNQQQPIINDFVDLIPYLNIDLKELLSRRVVDTTISEIVLRVKKNNDDNEASKLWEQFIQELREYNDLEKIHKTDTKYKSKYGKSIIGFDIWDKHPIIWFADNVKDNEAIRINGQKQYAIVCTRTYSTIGSGTPILKNKLVITNKNTSYLFLGGFGVSLKDNKKIQEINNGKLSPEKVKEGWIPLEWCTLQIPQYIQQQFRTGTIEHNYGVLPAMEMLNKDFVDNDNLISTDETPLDIYYSDWYPAESIIELINAFLQFISSEMFYDQTRIIGTFSQQDINNIIGRGKDNANGNVASILSKLQSRIQESNPENNVIKKRLILKSLGGEGSQLEKMQTTFKSLEYTQAMDQLITLFFKMSGYSWDTDNSKVYENVSQTLNSNRGVYESTKEKKVLFERQWKEFYSKVAFVWFKENGKPFINLDDAKINFEKYVDFQIISNILQQQNNDYQKVVELKMNDLISTYKAIKDLNPDMNDEEVKKELERINEESVEQQELDKWDNFNNQDFLGYEENNNPNIDINYDKED